MAAVHCSSLRAAPFPLRSFSPFSYSARARKCRSSYSPVVMEFSLKPLPFEMDALEPYMSKETLDCHWGQHHRAYVENLNKQIKGTELEGMTLEDLFKFGYNNGNPTGYFNNAGQVWNHEFFWLSIKPGGGKKPSGELLHLLKRDFGSFEAFVEEFRQAANTQFASGWAWLVAKKTDPLTDTKFGELAVEKTFNAMSPLLFGRIPLLTIDVWEHAYYLDYQNQRPDYTSSFVNELINWDMVAARLARAKAFINFYDVVVPDDQIEYV